MSVTQKLPSGTWRRYSADDGGYYFHNEETDQSVWDPPPGWADPEQQAVPSPSSASAPVPLDTLGETSVSRSGPSASVTASGPGRQSTEQPPRTSTLAGTDMHPGEVAAMRAQAGSTTAKESPRSDPEPKPRPKKDILRESSDENRCKCCATCTLTTCLLYFCIFFAIVTTIVLAVVLTLPQTVSCDSSDKNYFVKEVESPIIYSISSDSWCTGLAPYNLTVWGQYFLKYNDDKPTVKIGSWGIPATYLQNCSDVDVRKQDVSQCNEFTVTIPVDDGSHGGGAVTFSVVNEQPSSPHPAAKVSSSSCNTVVYSQQVLAVPAPRVDTFSPAAICSIATTTFTLSGDFFLQLRVDNTSAWQKPSVAFTGATSGIIPSNLVTLSDCSNLTIGAMGVAGYEYGQICKTLIATTQAYAASGLTSAVVMNPGPNQCQQRGNTTFFVAPPTTVTSASPASFCWTSTGGSSEVNLTGAFVAQQDAQNNIIPPSVLVDGQAAKGVTPMECTTLSTSSGNTFLSCNKLTIDWDIPNDPVGANTSYYPTFVISNANLTGCGSSFQPVALVAPPSLTAYPTILPVICNPTSIVTIRLGGTFTVGDSTLQFGFGGALGDTIFPVPNPNLFDCYSPNGLQNSSVTLCRGVDLSVSNNSLTTSDKASVKNQCLQIAATTSFNIVQVPAASTIATATGTASCPLPVNITVNAGATPFYRVGGVFYNSFTIYSSSTNQQTFGAPNIFENPATPCTPGTNYDTCTSLIVQINQRISFSANGGLFQLRVNTGTCTTTAPTNLFINNPPC